MCSVGWRLRHSRAALSRSRSGPSCCHVSCFSGSRSSPRFWPVPSSRPIGTGRLLWKTIRKTGDFTTGLRVDTGNVKSWQNFSIELFIVFFLNLCKTGLFALNTSNITLNTKNNSSCLLVVIMKPKLNTDLLQ